MVQTSIVLPAMIAALLASSCSRDDPWTALYEGLKAEGVAAVAEKPCGIKVSIGRLQSLARNTQGAHLSEVETRAQYDSYKEEARKDLNNRGQKAFCDAAWKKYGDNGLRLFAKAPLVEHLSPWDSK